ncbi:MAG: helix-turn-helix transcriptional regulator [Thermomicrobiales bacterium]
MHATPAVGVHLRTWRQRRHLSQLDLASEADISTKHLSFVETGRSQPSRDMLLRLAHHLGIPLRDQNQMLQAAGFAPQFSSGPLERKDAAAARRTIDLLLNAHEPFPALAIDRHWNLVASNGALQPLLQAVAPYLLEAPINVVRASLHPDGLAPMILNYVEWRGHLIDRLQCQFDQTADTVIADLLTEIRAYPISEAARQFPGTNRGLDYAIAIPLVIRLGDMELRFISTTTVFGTPTDVTLSELAIETFFPADEATLKVLTG